MLIVEESRLLGPQLQQESSSASNVQVNIFQIFKIYIINCYIIYYLGFHRELGVHITKIKSVNLDKWPKGVANNFTKISKQIIFILNYFIR